MSLLHTGHDTEPPVNPMDWTPPPRGARATVPAEDARPGPGRGESRPVWRRTRQADSLPRVSSPLSRLLSALRRADAGVGPDTVARDQASETERRIVLAARLLVEALVDLGLVAPSVRRGGLTEDGADLLPGPITASSLGALLIQRHDGYGMLQAEVARSQGGLAREDACPGPADGESRPLWRRTRQADSLPRVSSPLSRLLSALRRADAGVGTDTVARDLAAGPDRLTVLAARLLVEALVDLGLVAPSGRRGGLTEDGADLLSKPITASSLGPLLIQRHAGFGVLLAEVARSPGGLDREDATSFLATAFRATPRVSPAAVVEWSCAAGLIAPAPPPWEARLVATGPGRALAALLPPDLHAWRDPEIRPDRR